MIRKYLASKASIGILVTLILISAIGVTHAIGVDGPKVKDLSLQEAVDLALKNNPDITIASLSVKKAEAEDKNAKETAHDIKSDYINTYQVALVKWVSPKATEIALNLSKKSQEVTEKSVKFSVENDYYNVLKSERNLAIKREALNYFQEQLKTAQTAYKIGTKAKLDVNTIEAAVAAAQAQLVSEENTYRTAVMELNRLIGLDLDTPLKLTTQFNLDKNANSVKVDDTIKSALEDNIQIMSVKNNLELSKVKYDIAQKFYAGGVTAYDTAEVDAKIAEANVKKQELATISTVRQTFLTMSSLERVIDWNNKEVEKAQENARIYKLKYEAGLATSLDVKKAALDLEQAKETLAETVYKYNLIKSQFKYELFTSGQSTGSASSGSGSATSSGSY